jgi:superfamily II DNA or RNA helicase
MPDPTTDEYCKAVQDAALPGVWSKGVAASRNVNAVKLLSRKGSEWKVRVSAGERVAQPTVTLWLEDGDWYCDCGDRADPCPHVVTAALAAKAGRIVEGEVSADSAELGDGAPIPVGAVVYEFKADGNDLRLDRYIQRAGVEKEPLRTSLVSYVGGLQTGRETRPVNASKEDFAIDHALSGAPRTGIPGTEGLHFILDKLAGAPGVRFENQTIEVHAKPRPLMLVVEDSEDGARVYRREDPQFPGDRRGFSNGAVLIGNHLFPAEAHRWSELERKCLTPEGATFRARELASLIEDVLPALRRKCEVDIRTTRLPETMELPLEAVIDLDTHPGLGDGSIAAVARLYYGDVAELEGGELKLLKPGILPERDRELEQRLIRKLADELHLRVGQPAVFRGDEAVRFRGKVQLWKTRSRATGGDEAFAVRAPLAARIQGRAQPAMDPLSQPAWELELDFEVEGMPPVPARKVFEAWKTGQSFLALGPGQGWAPLPRDWLEKHGPWLEKMFLARGDQPAVIRNASEQLRVSGMLEEAGISMPEIAAKLRTALLEPKEQGAAKREGLRADLRHYQEVGVQWLSNLRRAGLGGILADDMGLGKTVQAIAASRGRTLVVCPASVMVAWKEQLARFVPQARVSIYAGAKRRLETTADFTLCTYGILRQDAGVLTPTEWDTVILDEAQTIKNRESQVTQAAFELKGRFRIALSGTPIENSVSDLVSILGFACPGAVTRDDTAELSSEQLKRRVRPLILRRLKKDVAPELPERTESVLRCALSSKEREAYNVLAYATQSEVAQWMQNRTGKAALQALESILRLRQACNHLALVPGQTASREEPSSKLALLMEQLEAAFANGHRALVFSQWTSFLDLIEPQLKARGLGYARLDGTTRDREAVVRDFQRSDGPPVMLLSLKAGGTGLTLTAADYVYIVDPWWNPAVEAQAADRAHRIGQDKSVFIYRLVAEDTIEEKVLALQEHKRALVADILGEEGGRMDALEPSEILELLS